MKYYVRVSLNLDDDVVMGENLLRSDSIIVYDEQRGQRF